MTPHPSSACDCPICQPSAGIPGPTEPLSEWELGPQDSPSARRCLIQSWFIEASRGDTRAAGPGSCAPEHSPRSPTDSRSADSCRRTESLAHLGMPQHLLRDPPPLDQNRLDSVLKGRLDESKQVLHRWTGRRCCSRPAIGGTQIRGRPKHGKMQRGSRTRFRQAQFLSHLS
jgi:hypothetical protein